ncbi:hypothetical protein [Streptomyces adelaidensis]|uniref:hypothetical protein n=1 Tax=Streptomyces adelaidensis TaxID=2796465 RepID=UPI001908B6F7|nr:hypothetical protein [Streptomyces adelaidensis]
MRYEIKAPVRSFNGTSAGVAFTDGIGTVADTDKPGRAALEYFRRHGYRVTPMVPEEAEEQDTDAQEPGAPKGTEPFEPSEHSAEEVIAYLDALNPLSGIQRTEFNRVIAAERGGKNRKTILARAGANEGDPQ